MRPLRGLTWSHRRGFGVLERLAGAPPPGLAEVAWERQTLSGFESAPIEALADRYDLLVVDHPGLGEAARVGALLALEDLVEVDLLASLRAATVGASFDSYRLAGRTLAFPIDADTQLGVVEATVSDCPTSLDEVRSLAAELPTLLCLGGPHALLMFSALCAALGAPPAGDGDRFVPVEVAEAAFAFLAELLRCSVARRLDLDPIDVLDAMARPDGPAYCPLVYAYLGYQLGQFGARRLRFVGAPVGPSGHRASVLGGTGLALTRSCGDPAAAVGYARTLLATDVQRELYFEEGAHSVLRAIWEDAEVSTWTNGFYREARASLDGAWLRPRFAGYVSFQSEGAEIVRQALRGERTAAAACAALDAAFAAAPAPAGTAR